MNLRGSNNQNGKVLSDLIAGQINKELKKKETSAQDLINNLNTEIVIR